MKSWSDTVAAYLKQNKDDLKYLLFLGIPEGILLILLSRCMDFTMLF